MRLVVEIAEDNGVGHVSTRDVPIVYESVEKLVSDIDAIVRERVERMEDLQMLAHAASKELMRLYREDTKSPDISKAQEEAAKCNTDVINNECFTIAGQRFLVDNFGYGEIRVQTLDEWYSAVEDALSKEGTQPVDK